MEFFKKSDKIRLKSYHGKYLYAEEDECMVSQSKNGSVKNAEWDVELHDKDASVIKLKSCYGCYLDASNEPFLLGMTGNKVLQMKLVGSESDSSKILWKPEKQGFGVKLVTQAGNYLRANSGIPPWRDSVTHDTLHRMTQDWLTWYVDPIGSPVNHVVPMKKTPIHYANASSSSSDDAMMPKTDDIVADLCSDGNGSNHHKLDSLPSCSSFTNMLFPIDVSVPTTSPQPEVSHTHRPKLEGRIIRYAIVDDDDDDETPRVFDSEFTFEGHDLGTLKETLKKLTGIEEDVYICATNHVNNKLFPLKLQLPPNNLPMGIVVVKSSTKLAKILDGGQQQGTSYTRNFSFDDE